MIVETFLEAGVKADTPAWREVRICVIVETLLEAGVKGNVSTIT